MLSIAKAPVKKSPSKGKRRGFSLVEAMVATFIFTLTMVGIYASVMKAYQFSEISRYRDEARSILLSFVDQFERLQATDDIGGVALRRPLFVTSIGGPTGTGLNWPELSDDVAGTAPVKTHLSVTLRGDGKTGIPAKVTRYVMPMRVTANDDDGVKNDGIGLNPVTNPTTASYSTSAGYLLLGVFSITYELPSGKSYTQRLSAVRHVP
jgi:Prokaryotic N-terminal methylation motif